MFKLFHPLEGTIINPHNVTSSCILISRHDHVLSFISSSTVANSIIVRDRSLKQRQVVKSSWNVMAHAQKPDFVFLRNERVHLNRRGSQFSRLLAPEVCPSLVVMLDTPCSEVVWRVLATHSIRQFPLHFPSRASPCAITFQLDSTASLIWVCGGGRGVCLWPGTWLMTE